MGAAIGGMLGNAAGIAISPIPIIALILMLFSRSAAVNGSVFLAGWIVGLLAVGVVVLAVGLEAGSGSPRLIGGIVKIAIGALFLVLGAQQWRKRPREGEEPAMPAWMASVADFSAAKAFGFGLLFSAVNPKNLGLGIAAAASISAQNLSAGGSAVVLAVYVVVASSTMIVPLGYFLLAPERAERMLTVLKDWLMANNATVMTVLFVVLGAKVLGDGLAVVF